MEILKSTNIIKTQNKKEHYKCLNVAKILVKKACKIGRICTITSKKACQSLQPLLLKEHEEKKEITNILQKNVEKQPNKDGALKPMRPTHGQWLSIIKISKTLPSTEQIETKSLSEW